MKVFITTGTYDYLKKVKEKYPEEAMVIMVNEDTALLLHETSTETLFNEPRKYEIIDSSGEIGLTGLAVMNNIPVTDEGRPLFEYSFKNRPMVIEKEQGFIALRVLRPKTSNTYIILTIWENELAFKNWQNSNNYSNEKSIATPPKGSVATAYVTKYQISE
ncbi:antibiotic biosynthesis monooxygenase [Neobacillus sp. PS3-40]|jgi:heme oxygenase (mycobilin-producing)|uniref:antibiotic biosynthesis monooxygenase family protein n=1 Tax=Neobacillus sp. PS3-40 TaxID=3070679 RepID=UPI0027E07315|nr:antibiotic biosynthesis monooxygenase [Neobacillus sp. PS3-40]WML43304.1 antibiotic biosynthesis monooxygenase [Neobacillus sp. PS3-40]